MTELRFKGKEFVYNHHLAVPFRPLVMHPEKGIGEPSLDGNLIVQGDNLHALKALLPLYAGKVDCIFIDPPYNTGNEGWCYSDNVNAPMIREWLAANPVGVEDGLRHDKWCAMMWPRLRLLHELLSEDGILLMHIDENELEHVSAIVDEIFGNDPESSGKSNRLGNIIWDKGNPKGDALGISYQHEFIVLITKCRSKALKKRPLLRLKPNAERMVQAGRQFFNKVGGTYIPGDLKEVVYKYGLEIELSKFKVTYDLNTAAEGYAEWVKNQQNLSGGERPYNKLDSEGNVYRLVHMGWPNKNDAPKEYFRPIRHPITEKQCPIPNRGWRYPPNTIDAMLGDNPPTVEPFGFVRKGEVVFGSDESVQPQRKYPLKDYGKENIPSVLRFGGSDDDFLRSIDVKFENAKPFRFVTNLVEWLSRGSDLILDSFAGSGTTGHAVLMANRNDSGRRKFILVQMDEGQGKINADAVTAARIRRVIHDDEKGELDEEVTASNETFTYCTLGPPLELDKLLSGEDLPSFEALGAALFHMATGRTLDPAVLREADFYVGEADGRHVWLIYRPDCEWLKSDAAALTLTRAREFQATMPDGRHLVFAAARFADSDLLAEENLRVEFAPLPFALYRLERG